MRFKYFISEARRNPDKNPKISLVQDIEKILDKDPGVSLFLAGDNSTPF